MRGLCFFIALLIAAAAAAGICNTDCAVHGFDCVTPGEVRDGCGSVIDATTCDIPSCPAYCKAVFGEDRGACNDAKHRCVCGASASVADSDAAAANAQAPVVKPGATGTGTGTGSACVPATCASIAAAFQCLPPRFVDPCTGQIIPLSQCVAELPTCNAQCAPENAKGSCTRLGDCICANGTVLSKRAANANAPVAERRRPATATAANANVDAVVNNHTLGNTTSLAAGFNDSVFSVGFTVGSSVTAFFVAALIVGIIVEYTRIRKGVKSNKGEYPGSYKLESSSRTFPVKARATTELRY